MKRKIWKLFAPIALIAVLIFSTILATGCYVIKGVKMRDLVGTYELTRYSAKTDLMAEREMKLYMIINSDGSGYYVYKDKDTKLYASKMSFNFETNAEDSSKYDYVHAQFNFHDEAVKFGVFGKNLNFQTIKWKPIEWGKPLEQDYTIDVDFNKVSKKTDLSYVNDVFDTNLTALPFGLVNLNYMYEASVPQWNGSYLREEELLPFNQEKPLYAFAGVDIFNNTLKFYYAYPSAKQPLTKVFDVVITPQEAGTFSIVAENFNATLITSRYSTKLTIEQAVQDKEGTSQVLVWEFNRSVELDYDLTETINNALTVQTERETVCETAGKHEWSINACNYDKICKICSLIEKAKEHTYDDDADRVCNICSQTRELPQQTPAA